jgi:valyl-tRNA synthetase
MNDIILNKYDHSEIEKRVLEFWKEKKIFKYERNSSKEVFSIDTPPPYVSADHIHVGHAVSYAHQDFVARFWRMRGKNVFYPIGFDNNGLPTERHVEKKYDVNKKKISREEFRNLCIKETLESSKNYMDDFLNLGISIDTSLYYQTNDEHASRTAQKSFIELFRKGKVYRSNDPVLWDTTFESALAQADLETVEREGVLYDIVFKDENGKDLIISTTRPELLPACVALYFNPDDKRYSHLEGKKAKVPLFDIEVPVKTSDAVEKDFGTGLMMVCTFGDSEDVLKWKLDKLDTRVVINKDGRMNEKAGFLSGLKVKDAKKKVVEELKSAGVIKGEKKVIQYVSIGERSEQPVEFIMVPQWFLKNMEMKDEIIKRGKELNWHPEFMRVRLDNWVNGVKYDWNISRQRFHGVCIPLWICQDCGEVILAKKEDLPVDPTVDNPPVDKCPKCGSDNIKGESDVFDTWFTSSVTPFINSNWVESEENFGDPKVFPMDLHPQAHEIIRTWLYYTLVHTAMHTEKLPWRNVMISGWVLAENGEKLSKRKINKYTDKSGYNPYFPHCVMERHGADAFRYVAGTSSLGQDVRYSEQEIKKVGRKVVLKLWNATKFVLMHLSDFDPKDYNEVSVSDRTLEDRWVLKELNDAISGATKALEQYNYPQAKALIDSFFWNVFTDNYLEIVKDRFLNRANYSRKEIYSGQVTLWEVIRKIVGLFAPFIPFVTEEIYQKVFREYEEKESIHLTDWPAENGKWETDVSDMEIILEVLEKVRGKRSEMNISQGKLLRSVILNENYLSIEKVRRLERNVKSAIRVLNIEYKPGDSLVLDLKTDD